jgi:RNA-directed DNA polymerase
MKLTLEHRAEIKEQFSKIATVEQLAELLQWIYDKKFPKAKERVTIEGRDLNYYAFKKQDRYINFEIPKKNKDEKRPISAPRYKLKTIQKSLNEVLTSVFEPHKASYGFISNKSVVDNARLHVGKNFVYNIDIEGFFPSTEFRRVKTVLMLRPFSLQQEKETLAFLIANLCCDNGALPQGAPTSPTLTNIVCQRLDKRLTQLAKRYKATYTRYADDITFSSYYNIFDKWFKARLKVIIERQERYKINLGKERLQDWNKRQVVTGVVVNKKLNVERTYIKDVRYWLRTWDKFKEEATQAAFEIRFPEKKGFMRNNGAPISFRNYLLGKILYLGMVRGHDDKMYQKFMNTFTNQMESIKVEDKGIELYQLMTIWEQKGIEEAMQHYFDLKNQDGTKQS